MPKPTLSRRRMLMLMASGPAAQAAPAARCESAAPEPWSRFRGPSGSGIAPPGVEYPIEFGPKRNVIWKRAFPAGKSSPILTSNRILLTAETGDRLQVIAVDRNSGKTAWERSIQRSRNEYKNPLNDAASSTAVTDGANVYAFFGDYGLVSFDARGRERWRTPIAARSSLWGCATSPVLAGDTVVLLADGFTQSSAMGFDCRTGRLQWESPRAPFTLNYATPLVRTGANGHCEALAVAPNELVAYDPANGERRWSEKLPPGSMISSPVVTDRDTVLSMVYSLESRPPFPDRNADGIITETDIPTDPKEWQTTRTLRMIGGETGDRDGNVTPGEWAAFWDRYQGTPSIRATGIGANARGLRWSHTKGVARVATPIVYDEIVYYVNAGGILTALDARTGAPHKVGRLEGALDNYYASPVIAAGRLYLASETGKVAVVQPGADWKLIAVNDLDEPCYATPALSGGRIYVRTAASLACYGS